MKHSLKTLAFTAAIAAMALPLTAQAQTATDQKVVHDIRGDVVRDIRGNCVETKWQADKAECGVAAPDYFSRMEVVYFGYDSAAIKPEEKAKLDAFVAANQDAKDVVTFRITGYADQTGNEAYNRALSLKRAEAVRGYLAANGFNTSAAQVAGMGESNSVTDCKAANKKSLIQCLAPDRRVEITVEGAK